ncbi:MAG: DUF4384 domain-containing protein [Desulfatibacillum sp.]|nr:DUF4384 domain-containing protein [Desulfatibacillum sp.]
MLKQNAKTVSLAWEDFFDQATEDTSIYLWAAQSWLAPPTEYSQGYMLTLALAHRARSYSAQGWIRDNVPAEMAHYAASLDKMFRKAESIMAAHVAEAGEKMEAVLDGQVISMVHALDNSLNRVLRLEEDCHLYENQPDFALELREAAHEFLLRFSLMHHLKNQLLSPMLTGLESTSIQSAITHVENRFESFFDRFYAVEDLWPALSAREYGAGLWWLERTPQALDPWMSLVTEPLMAAFGQTLARETRDLDDHMARTAIALALDEMDPALESSLLEDLAMNSKAMDLMHDVRQAAQMARDREGAPPYVLPALARAVRQPSPLGKWLDAAYQSLSGMLSPKLAAAAAMACLALFVFIALPTGKDSGQVVSNTAKLASVSPDAIMPQGKLGLTARKNESGLSRVSALGASGPDIFEMEPGWNLESGDSLRVTATVDQDAFVYVIHIGPGKVATDLFSGAVKAGDVVELPASGEWFVLDKKVGVESVVLVSGPEPMDDYASVLAGITSAGDIAQAFSGRDVRAFSFKHL